MEKKFGSRCKHGVRKSFTFVYIIAISPRGTPFSPVSSLCCHMNCLKLRHSNFCSRADRFPDPICFNSSHLLGLFLVSISKELWTIKLMRALSALCLQGPHTQCCPTMDSTAFPFYQLYDISSFFFPTDYINDSLVR